VQPPDELIDVTLACPDIPEGDNLGIVIFGDIGNGKRIFVDIKTDVECAIDVQVCFWKARRPV
jgi:hypothetical protein